MTDKRPESWHARAAAGVLPTLDGGRSTREEEDLLTAFFKWLERFTETMDPTMIRLAHSTGHRYLSDDKIAQLIERYFDVVDAEPQPVSLQRGA